MIVIAVYATRTDVSIALTRSTRDSMFYDITDGVGAFGTSPP